MPLPPSQEPSGHPAHRDVVRTNCHQTGPILVRSARRAQGGMDGEVKSLRGEVQGMAGAELRRCAVSRIV
jgi:hypothetical protein